MGGDIQEELLNLRRTIRSRGSILGAGGSDTKWRYYDHTTAPINLHIARRCCGDATRLDDQVSRGNHKSSSGKKKTHKSAKSFKNVQSRIKYLIFPKAHSTLIENADLF